MCVCVHVCICHYHALPPYGLHYKEHLFQLTAVSIVCVCVCVRVCVCVYLFAASRVFQPPVPPVSIEPPTHHTHTHQPTTANPKSAPSPNTHSSPHTHTADTTQTPRNETRAVPLTSLGDVPQPGAAPRVAVPPLALAGVGGGKGDGTGASARSQGSDRVVKLSAR